MPIIGLYIQRLTGLDQFSPPFPRGGQGILLTVEVFDVPPSAASLTVAVDHKNEADTSWITLGGLTLSTVGVSSVKLGSPPTGLKELVRLRYTITGGIPSSVHDTFYVNVPPPTWVP